MESDTRPIEEQMAAVGMYDTEHQCPTYAAVVLFGYKPRRFMPGLYVQYVRFKGREEMVSNYPYQAIRELLLNACMHRDMQSNTPLRFYEFASHLEILNAGGLYGNARPENFPRINDYRNPLVASAMKTLGYVNMFSRGIGQVQTDLKENGNKPAQFDVSMLTAFLVIVEQKDIEQFKFVPSDGAPMASSGDDVTSLSQALSQVCPKLDVSQLKELMEKTKEKNRGRIKNNVLQHLCESGLVEPTIKDVPNSPKQKYTLTDEGREKLQAIS